MELRELNNKHPLALDKIKIKREMLSEYQLKITDLYNIVISNVKKNYYITFLIKKVCASFIRT